MIFSFLIATFVMSVFCLFFVCSTKIGENSDISKCFENFVSLTLGVLTRIYAAELRYEKNSISKTWRKPVEQGKQIYRLGKC